MSTVLNVAGKNVLTTSTINKNTANTHCCRNTRYHIFPFCVVRGTVYVFTRVIVAQSITLHPAINTTQHYIWYVTTTIEFCPSNTTSTIFSPSSIFFVLLCGMANGVEWLICEESTACEFHNIWWPLAGSIGVPLPPPPPLPAHVPNTVPVLFCRQKPNNDPQEHTSHGKLRAGQGLCEKPFCLPTPFP